nr:immunoglobulin heavy chain junction region [Mus musculus]NSM04654.1 immunoglobulin heavy chain junction region [Mus musculus]NSM06550.1 immunoglobulin heavy chain junction region [Mus musculus]NSM08647.1 immunoglobulin heavy chain junction region [Mus musculus]NSM09389.1 immunoglobulin heavy chain junction region [Mus musculus]
CARGITTVDWYFDVW